LYTWIASTSFFLRPASYYLHADEMSIVFPHTQIISFMGLAKRIFTKGEILVGIKERDKQPVINPKVKTLSTPLTPLLLPHHHTLNLSPLTSTPIQPPSSLPFPTSPTTPPTSTSTPHSLLW
jgi:hypothetical protein